MPEAKTTKDIEVKGETFTDIVDKDRALIMAIQELTNMIRRLASNG
jgi:hypothetical protein|tara:strand:+ start:56 stop:193 length:138 start_codon:yes stop_codon:yes gene_type:complete